MTEEQIKKNSHIPTNQVITDILDTEEEIKDYEAQLVILRKRPQENKMKIFMIEGNISNRKNFIKDLNDLLEYRKNHVDQK